MHLLSQKEVKKASVKQKDKGREIDEYLSKKTKELNEFKDAYEKKKKVILDDFVSFAEDIAGQRSKLEGRFASLEERKGVTFKSLSDLSTKAEKKLEEAQRIESAFDVKERNLEAREDNVKDATKRNEECEKVTNTRAEFLSRKAKDITECEQDLNRRKTEFASKVQQKENVLTSKEKKIDDRLEELRLGIEANDNMADLLELRETNFEQYKKDQERLLQDKRDTLNRGFSELSTKQRGK